MLVIGLYFQYVIADSDGKYAKVAFVLKKEDY